MQNKIKFLLNLVLLLVILTGCATLPKPVNKRDLLLKNTNKWSNFSLEGIANINYKQLTFRKMILIKKNNDSFLANIIDSGVMGMNPTPFASIKIDSSLTVSMMGNSQKIPISSQLISSYFNSDFVMKHQNEIIKNLEYQTEQVSIYWNEEMQVIRISSQDILAKMNYDFKGDLAKLDIYYQEELVLEIIVDEIIYK